MLKRRSTIYRSPNLTISEAEAQLIRDLRRLLLRVKGRILEIPESRMLTRKRPDRPGLVSDPPDVIVCRIAETAIRAAIDVAATEARLERAMSK